ncbi:hypothetical protein N9D23_15275, partial [Rubripirellula sp.]|nr:hypothetical protein [Rubripirellula sp.]
HRSAGYSMRLVIEGQLHRAFTSLFFTAGGWRFYSSIVMFASAVGYVEWTFGPLRATATFFAVHLTTLAMMTLGVLVASAISETHRGNLLWHVQDVGPSAGYYGCLGVAIVALASPMRWHLVTAIVVVLCLRTTWSFIHLPEDGRMLSADIAQLIAFPLGIASAFT